MLQMTAPQIGGRVTSFGQLCSTVSQEGTGAFFRMRSDAKGKIFHASTARRIHMVNENGTLAKREIKSWDNLSRADKIIAIPKKKLGIERVVLE